jgi:ribosomal protein S18 acetylase RimI-like enzyme
MLNAENMAMRSRLIVRGGPGSGNFDHAGRPGLVGGSTTTSGTDLSVYEKALSKSFNNGGLNEQEREAITHTFHKFQVPLKDLKDVVEYSTKATPEYETRPDGYFRGKDEQFNTLGLYYWDDKKIVLAPVNFDGNRLTEQGEHTLLHELGHSAERNRASNNRLWWGIGYLRSVLQSESDRDSGLLKDLGLRKYSFKNDREFYADLYAIKIRNPKLFDRYKPYLKTAWGLFEVGPVDEDFTIPNIMRKQAKHEIQTVEKDDHCAFVSVPAKDDTPDHFTFTPSKKREKWTIRGGPGSGNFEHAGRPGEVGGSSTTSSKLMGEVDSIEDVHWEPGFGSGYFLYGSKVLDLKKETHIDYIMNNSENSLKLGVTQKEIDTMNKLMYQEDDPIGELHKMLYKIMERTGLIRVRVFVSEVGVNTPVGDTQTLHKIQDLYYQKRLFKETKQIKYNILWEIPGRNFIVPLNQFLLADKFHDLASYEQKRRYIRMLIRGGPGSGNFGHAGRPGEVGGSETSSNSDYDYDQWLSNKFSYSSMDKELLVENVGKVVGEKNVAKFLKDTYEIKRGDFSTEIIGIRPGTVYGEIRQNEKVVGSFRRTLDGDIKDVHHSYFELKKEAQESGFGTEYYQHCEDMYKTHGWETVTLRANLDVGGYAWARMGFDFDSDASARSIMSEFRSVYFRAGGVEYRQADLKPWEIAVFEVGGKRIGKEVLLGTDWYAIKRLNNNDIGYQVGQIYYREKAKKK